MLFSHFLPSFLDVDAFDDDAFDDDAFDFALTLVVSPT